MRCRARECQSRAHSRDGSDSLGKRQPGLAVSSCSSFPRLSTAVAKLPQGSDKLEGVHKLSRTRSSISLRDASCSVSALGGGAGGRGNCQDRATSRPWLPEVLRDVLGFGTEARTTVDSVLQAALQDLQRAAELQPQEQPSFAPISHRCSRGS